MGSLLLRRLGQSVFVLVFVATAVFVISRSTGNPAVLLAPPDAGPEEIDLIEERLGLNDPYLTQYLRFVGDAATGDFGESILHRRPAIDVYVDRLPATLELAVLSMAFSLLIAVPLGVVAAIREGRIADRFVRYLTAFALAVPHFWLGLILIRVVAVDWELTPPTGRTTPASYILPVITIATGLLAILTRLVRSGMLEARASDFVSLFRGAGISERRINALHCLRHAIVPVFSYAGVYLGLLLGGAVVTETVFAWPGIGRVAYESVTNRDYPMLQTIVIMTSVAMVMINLVVDVLYAVIDPRVRYDR